MEGWIMADIRTSSLGSPISFTVVTSTGGSKTAEFTTAFPAGVYTIYSIAGDNDLEIYLGAEDGSNVGYSTNGNKAIVASAPFKYVTTANANSFDAIVFELYQVSSEAATLNTKTDAFWAPPVISDVTPSSLYNKNATTVITGSNFASNAGVQFRKSDDATLVSAKSVTRTSATSITATRPDSFLTTDAPYDVIVTNPTAGLSFISSNAVTAGSAPSWTTSATLPAFQKTVAYSQSVVATDIDVSPTITYSVNSSTLPAGITFSAGTFSGTPTANSGSYSASIRATDLGGNFVDRTFTLVQDKPDAPTAVTATQTGSTTATVSFTAPTYTGTSTITSYTATSSPAGGTGSVSQSGSGTITVTGLTGSTQYTFTVKATNSSGVSLESSASSSITTAAPAIQIEYLVVAGGGGAASSHGAAGGGAGGVRYSASYILDPGSTITVGAGGTATPGNATNGNDSILSTVTATGGGLGSDPGIRPGNGGSGGGGRFDTAPAGGTGISGQGHNGGSGYPTGGNGQGGGGGGAGAAGGAAGGGSPGTGGAGAAYSIIGSSTFYGGGGGGSGEQSQSRSGGSGGGGNAIGGDGGANLGGGGGAGLNSTRGGYGGSGVVIIAYPNTTAPLSSISAGLTYDQPTRSGYRVYRFTAGTGTVSP
jgi:hypothetical protein